MNRLRVADIPRFSALVEINGKKLLRTTHRDEFKNRLRLPISEGNRLRSDGISRYLNLIGKCVKIPLDRARSGIFNGLGLKMTSNRIGSGAMVLHAP